MGVEGSNLGKFSKLSSYLLEGGRGEAAFMEDDFEAEI
jgi:hypothetical protein